MVLVIIMQLKVNLITHGTGFTSFHPFKNASKVKMMITSCHDFRVVCIIFCRECRIVKLKCQEKKEKEKKKTKNKEEN